MNTVIVVVGLFVLLVLFTSFLHTNFRLCLGAGRVLRMKQIAKGLTNLFLGGTVSDFVPFAVHALDKPTLGGSATNRVNNVRDNLTLFVFALRGTVGGLLGFHQSPKAAIAVIITCHGTTSTNDIVGTGLGKVGAQESFLVGALIQHSMIIIVDHVVVAVNMDGVHVACWCWC